MYTSSFGEEQKWRLLEYQGIFLVYRKEKGKSRHSSDALKIAMEISVDLRLLSMQRPRVLKP